MFERRGAKRLHTPKVLPNVDSRQERGYVAVFIPPYSQHPEKASPVVANVVGMRNGDKKSTFSQSPKCGGIKSGCIIPSF